MTAASRHAAFAAADGDLLALPAGYAMQRVPDRSRVSAAAASASPTWPTIPISTARWRSRSICRATPPVRGPRAEPCGRTRLPAPSPSPGVSIASCSNAARSPAFTIPASCACCAISAPTTPAYMVMEYESGEPLDNWLAGREPLDRRKPAAHRAAAARRARDHPQRRLPASRHQAAQHLHAGRRLAGAARLRLRPPSRHDAGTAAVADRGRDARLCAGRAVPARRQAGAVERPLLAGRGDVLAGHRSPANREPGAAARGPDAGGGP
jgi:hypothetical protein